ncbi:MAG: hypothetical protein WB761_09375, partial [Solirubrobacteraceae bacterium]
MGALVKPQLHRDLLAPDPSSGSVREKVKKLARRRGQLPVEPRRLIGVVARPGLGLVVPARA